MQTIGRRSHLQWFPGEASNGCKCLQCYVKAENTHQYCPETAYKLPPLSNCIAPKQQPKALTKATFLFFLSEKPWQQVQEEPHNLRSTPSSVALILEVDTATCKYLCAGFWLENHLPVKQWMQWHLCNGTYSMLAIQKLCCHDVTQQSVHRKSGETFVSLTTDV